MSGPGSRKFPQASDEDWIQQLSQLPNARERRSLVSKRLRSNPAGLANQLYEGVMRRLSVDLQGAGRIAQALEWLASRLRDDYAIAQSLRARGHVLYLTSNYLLASQKHQAALKIFERLKAYLQAALTISGMLQSLIYLGKYDRAFRLATKARKIFEKNNDRLRLARLDSNVGNILHRLDRFSEGLEHYERAYHAFRETNHSEDMAVALHNMALCSISLNRFDDALGWYRDARAHWEREHKPLLVARADYNVAYLHYLRGEYTRAIELYELTRVLCTELGDRYLVALCDLDQAEMYLELNLSDDAWELGRKAYEGLSSQSLNYEAAKALTFQAMAARQKGQSEQALDMFDRARLLFVRETNDAWCALIDIHKALVLMDRGDRDPARILCESALKYFRSSDLVSKAAHCELLLAKIALQDNKLKLAKRYCAGAFRRLAKGESPVAEFEAFVTQGQVLEASQQHRTAYKSFHHAHEKLEGLRSHLLGEEFKIAFLKDKLSVYESLFLLALSRHGGSRDREAAFDFAERAKSRSLADLIAFQVSALQPRTGSDPAVTSRLRELEEKLTSTHHQARREELQSEKPPAGRLQRLGRKSRSYQSELNNILSGMGSADEEFASLLSAGTVPLEKIQSSLPTDGLLLEYYEARGRIYAFIVSSREVEIVKLGAADDLRSAVRLLQFQLSKFRLGEHYVRQFSQVLRSTTDHHLQELYAGLVAPLRSRLKTSQLTIVPHGFLHYLPFHALNEGGRYLVDDFAISYAPSASVYYLCATRPFTPQHDSLVMGIPDPLAPYIANEARAVAASLPNSRLVMGDAATHELLQQYAPQCKYVHIATHGLFRQDNPMFSSIRLGRSELNLFDLYRLRLSSELVTLSGCGTGLNVVVGGDELLGLVRGLLYAGSRSTLVTLWDVNDESTSEFMVYFYGRLAETENKAVAVQQAMQEIRGRYPHPYHWAPFLLIGKSDSVKN